LSARTRTACQPSRSTGYPGRREQWWQLQRTCLAVSLSNIRSERLAAAKTSGFVDLIESRAGHPTIRAFVVPEDAPANAATIEQIRAESEEVLVVAADHSVVMQIKRMAAVLARSNVQTARQRALRVSLQL
jgi:hypothetical protein